MPTQKPRTSRSARSTAAPQIAVLIPCFNEAPTIADVVKSFQQELPSATVYVFDNDSTDNSVQLAREAGAVVARESRRGKGYVVRSMFMLVEADLYVLVDGDATYSAHEVHSLLAPVLKNDVDMTVGDRLSNPDNRHCFPPLHVFGNQLVAQAVNFSFGSELRDIMSGYRVFSRRLVKSLPLVSRGFEIETQMTVQALYYSFRIREVPISYKKRVEGSFSKLNTYRDGAKVLLTIANALKAYRPLAFFGLGSLPLFLFGLSALLGPCSGMVAEAASHCNQGAHHSGLAVVLLLAGCLSLAAGLILDVANHRIRELAQLFLLKYGDGSTQKPGARDNPEAPA